MPTSKAWLHISGSHLLSILLVITEVILRIIHHPEEDGFAKCAYLLFHCTMGEMVRIISDVQDEQFFKPQITPDKNSQKIMRERGQGMVEWRGKRHWPSSFISLEMRAGIHSRRGNHFSHSTSHDWFEFASPFAIGTDVLCQCSEPSHYLAAVPAWDKRLLSRGRADRGGAAATAVLPPKSSVSVSFPLKALTSTTGTQPWAEGKVLKAHRQPQLAPL